MGKSTGLIIVLVLAVTSCFGLLSRGLPPTHDGEYHVVRFYEFDKVLRDGDLYPRWAPDLNNGFGVPLFNYVYPLPNYASSIFHFFGLSFIDSFKLNLFLASLVGAVFFYLWARIWWGSLGGIVSSVFYTFSPYHFVDIYVRGSPGEVWALAFFPAALWASTKLAQKLESKYALLLSTFIALIVFSHNILALMFFPLLISYLGLLAATSKYKKVLMAKSALAVLLGLGLSSIFWLPAFFEKNYARGLQVFGVEDHFPDLYQLLIPSWGTGFSGTGIQNQMSFQLGLANLLGVVLNILVLTKIKKNKTFYCILFFVAWFFLIFFLMLKMSLPIWEKVPLTNYFQFPWRFLSLSILVSSFLSGSIFLFLRGKAAVIIGIFMIVVAVGFSMGYTKPAYFLKRDDSYYINRSNFIDSTNSPGNAFNTIWFKDDLQKEKEKLKFVDGNGKVESSIIKSTDYKFEVSASAPSGLQVSTSYFPGWKVLLDKKEIQVQKTEEGLFAFDIPEGFHQIEVKFRNTGIRSFASFISAASLLIVFAVLGFDRIKKRT